MHNFKSLMHRTFTPDEVKSVTRGNYSVKLLSADEVQSQYPDGYLKNNLGQTLPFIVVQHDPTDSCIMFGLQHLLDDIDVEKHGQIEKIEFTGALRERAQQLEDERVHNNISEITRYAPKVIEQLLPLLTPLLNMLRATPVKVEMVGGSDQLVTEMAELKAELAEQRRENEADKIRFEANLANMRTQFYTRRDIREDPSWGRFGRSGFDRRVPHGGVESPVAPQQDAEPQVDRKPFSEVPANPLADRDPVHVMGESATGHRVMSSGSFPVTAPALYSRTGAVSSMMESVRAAQYKQDVALKPVPYFEYTSLSHAQQDQEIQKIIDNIMENIESNDPMGSKVGRPVRFDMLTADSQNQILIYIDSRLHMLEERTKKSRLSPAALAAAINDELEEISRATHTYLTHDANWVHQAW